MGVLGNLGSTVDQGLKKTGGVLNVTRKKRLGEKKSTTQSEIIFMALGALLGLAYALLVEEEEKNLATSIILGVPTGAVAGLLFGYLVDMVSVTIEVVFTTLTSIIKKTAPPLVIIAVGLAVLFAILWAYTKEFGPIGPLTFEQINPWMVKTLDVIKIIFDNTFIKLFDVLSDLLSSLWDFLLNH